MDKTKLIDNLQPFFEECAKRQKPLAQACLEEFISGDKELCVLRVKSNWIDDVSCSEALEFLFDVLWDTVAAKTREKLFYIQLVGMPDQSLCQAENNIVRLDKHMENGF